jgi:hypothetical protein
MANVDKGKAPPESSPDSTERSASAAIQSVFVRGRKQALCQQTLNVRQKPDLFGWSWRRQLFAPVIGFFVNDPPDTTARIRHVSLVPRDDVHMSVLDSLPCRQAVIHTNVKAVRF